MAKKPLPKRFKMYSDTMGAKLINHLMDHDGNYYYDEDMYQLCDLHEDVQELIIKKVAFAAIHEIRSLVREYQPKKGE